MSSVTLEEAQANLGQLIDNLKAGETLLITRNNQPIARIQPNGPPKRKPRKPGNCAGMMTIVSDDDEHLKDFAEYMG